MTQSSMSNLLRSRGRAAQLTLHAVDRMRGLLP